MARVVRFHKGTRVRFWTSVLVRYHYARIHKTLRMTPAMEAGISDHVWSFEEIVGLLDRG